MGTTVAAKPEEKKGTAAVRAPAACPGTQWAESSGAQAGLPLFLNGPGGPLGVQTKLVSGQAGDPFEREADRVADEVTGGLPKQLPPSLAPAIPPQPNASAIPTADAGLPLSPDFRERVEPSLGADLSQVRVHGAPGDRQMAQSLGAKAFTHGRDIWLGPSESPADLKLMAHEAAHVVQQTHGDGPNVQRQPAPDAGAGQSGAGQNGGPLACVPPPLASYTFIGPEPPPPAPASLWQEVQITSPGIHGAKDVTQTIVLDEPILSYTPIVYYAIPIDLTSLGEAGANQCKAPAAVSQPKDKQQTSTPAPVATLPFPFVPRIPTVEVEGVPIAVETVTDAYVITSQYRHLAVGAGAAGVLETKQGLRLIDAGVGTDGGVDISHAILDRLSGIIGDRPIFEVMITHLHEDHTSLLPSLAERFPIGKLRAGAVQFADPRFKDLLKNVAEAQARGVQERAAREFDAKRSEWEAGEGSRIGDVKLRAQAFENAKAQFMTDALAKLRANPTMVELFVPNGGKLQVANAPLDNLPALTGGTADPLVEGYRRAGVPGDIADTAFSDPNTGKILREQEDRAATDKKARIEDADIDTASTSYIIDLPGGNRLVVVPDVRTSDLKRKAQDSTGAARSNFEAELAKLGHPARFQAWNMTHHMQSGWVEGGAPHIAGPGELVGFIKLMQDLRTVQAAKRGPGEAAPADLITVSAQHDIATRTMVNPGMVWFLRSLGFEVFLAASGRDVRLIEAITAGGQRIAGVSGVAFEGLRPSDPLLMQSEAAIRWIDEKIQSEPPKPERKGMKTADFNAASAARKARIARFKAIKKAIVDARAELIKVASEAFWKGVHDKAPAKPERAAEVPKYEQALRDAMKAPELSDFKPPDATAAPIVTDTALVLMRIQGDQPVDTRAQQIADGIAKADNLRAKVQSGESPAQTKAALTAQLEELRKLVEAQLPDSPEASRPALQEELTHLQQELVSLVRSPEGQVLFSREAGTGRLVENRIVRAPASKATEVTRQVIGGVNRFLGALMVYQTVRSEAQLEEQLKAGQVTKAQAGVGAARNIQGVTIGLRMMTAVEVNPAEFVVMSVLDITQAALGNYDTPEQRAVAISESAIRSGVSLFLMAVSTGMMESGNPWIMGAGFAIVFLTEPIMSFLDYLGVFDAIERASAFLPSEVTGANQHLRDLMKDYRAILGAMQLSARTDEQLRSLGVQDTSPVRSSSLHDIDTYRTEAVSKETELLSAFEDGYKRARDDYAGLYELDSLRSQFLTLRQQVRAGDTRYDTQSRQSALDRFAAIDQSLSLEGLTPQQVDDMPQWSHLEDAMDDFRELVQAESVDWEDVRKKEQDVEQMLRNARYRLDPAAFGMRSDALLSPNAPGRQAYENKLSYMEFRMQNLVASMTQRVGAGAAGTAVDPKDSGSLLAAYNQLLDNAPSPPDVNAVYRGSIAYEAWVNEHDDYKNYLDRLRSLEIAMQGAAAREPEKSGPPAPGDLPPQAKVRSAISRRSQQLGYLYVDEYHQMYGAIHDKLADRLAPMLGEPEGVQPLSAEEKAALKRGELKDLSGKLSSITNSLQDVKGLIIPDDPNEPVGGLRRVVGDIDQIDLIIIGIPGDEVTADQNVLVGIVGAGEEVITGSGHDVTEAVVPLNAAAIERLGGGRRMLGRRFLQYVRLKELLPAAGAKK
ncbi:MAG: DUF4157 domain-containing protein [Bryobacteraceae bacterium]